MQKGSTHSEVGSSPAELRWTKKKIHIPCAPPGRKKRKESKGRPVSGTGCPPKAPGCKPYFRYRKYRKASEVGEALKLDIAADWQWESDRRLIKVFGGPFGRHFFVLEKDGRAPGSPAQAAGHCAAIRNLMRLFGRR
eukprot:gnl/TRDRNA2_/TRDRNA2_163823_c0_seq1.p1 gnl/TRDRNA2_/TRDRNA2_163823_c0~~gnl/TRDRNA2_/TRDRNA2_163823_c0_seq1.p1  ORF type:complete len:137 (-),score=17.87 gnl/TRDRNA2_/TRDRNA2_163823_c0_seq1:163-573(-)